MKHIPVNKADVAASFQQAVIDVLCDHTIAAAKGLGMKKIAIAGGVAANSSLRSQMAGKADTFIQDNRKALILVVGILLILLLLLILMILLRSTRDYRSKKKLRAARREAQRLEEESEAKSTAEIEEELRQAMAMEEERRSEEDWRKDPGLDDLDLSKRSERGDGDRSE